MRKMKISNRKNVAIMMAICSLENIEMETIVVVDEVIEIQSMVERVKIYIPRMSLSHTTGIGEKFSS